MADADTAGGGLYPAVHPEEVTAGQTLDSLEMHLTDHVGDVPAPSDFYPQAFEPEDSTVCDVATMPAGRPVTVSAEDRDRPGSSHGTPNGSASGRAALFRRSLGDISLAASAGAGDNNTAQVGEMSYWTEVRRQTAAMLTKNFILARRNSFSTFLRLFVSFFFTLLIFLVNEGVKTRFAGRTAFKDLQDPPRHVIHGIPACSVEPPATTCRTFGYAPAPFSEFVPELDLRSLPDFVAAVNSAGRAPPGVARPGAPGPPPPSY